jgi:uncharacterized protein YbjT (DUF2867 family)
MKFVITGSAGNVSKPLVEILLEKGHDVTVVGRSVNNLAGLVKLGAKAAVGDMQDVPFLTDLFKGADGVYLMLPPMWSAADQKKLSIEITEGFAQAIRASGVKNAVFLSSYGAHRLDDAGPISGMGLGERVLNKVEGLNVLHLRAGYFYTNLLLSIDLVKKAGHMGNMFEIPEGTFTLVDPYDIAVAAADALVSQKLKGSAFVYVVSDISGTDEIASLIGKEIGMPDLAWKRIPTDVFRNVLLSYGFAEGAANDYVEMFATLDKGLLFEDFFASKGDAKGTSIDAFAKKFAVAYQ